MKVKATVFKGTGNSARKMKIERDTYPPEIKNLLHNVQNGTINLRLEIPIIILNWDQIANIFPWTNNCPENKVYLKSCWIKNQLQKDIHCWIYTTYLSPKNMEPYEIELIAAPLEGIRDGEEVTIEFDDGQKISAIEV